MNQLYLHSISIALSLYCISLYLWKWEDDECSRSFQTCCSPISYSSCTWQPDYPPALARLPDLPILYFPHFYSTVCILLIFVWEKLQLAMFPSIPKTSKQLKGRFERTYQLICPLESTLPSRPIFAAKGCEYVTYILAEGPWPLRARCLRYRCPGAEGSTDI